MSYSNKPAPIRAHRILEVQGQAESYEKSQFGEAWGAAYDGDMAAAQAVFDALPTVTDSNQPAVTAAQVALISRMQGSTHNVCHAVRRNPALVQNAKVAALIAALQAFADDDDFPAEIPVLPPYDFAINPDGSVTLTEIPGNDEIPVPID